MRGAVVHGYEACEENATVARENLRLNGCLSTVTTAFIGAKNTGATEVGFNERTPARSGGFQKENRRAVDNLSLAEQIEKHRPQGLKIDIEGAEMELLEARFPLDGIRAIVLEYHFRVDKSCVNARERIGWLCSHFKHNRMHISIRRDQTWGGWTDQLMYFWN
jgi:FkbM family methyltransferase